MRLWNGLKMKDICYIDDSKIFHIVVGFFKDKNTQFVKLENTKTKEIVEKKCIDCLKAPQFY